MFDAVAPHAALSIQHPPHSMNWIYSWRLLWKKRSTIICQKNSWRGRINIIVLLAVIKRMPGDLYD